MEGIDIQLARLDERFKFIEQLPKQISDLELKIDAMTNKLSSDFVRKDELERILAERKSALVSWQNVVWAIVILILSAVVNAGLSKM